MGSHAEDILDRRLLEELVPELRGGEDQGRGHEVEVHREDIGAHLGKVVAYAARKARDIDVESAVRGEVVEDESRHVAIADVEEAVRAKVICNIDGGRLGDALREVCRVRRRGHDEGVVEVEIADESALDLHAHAVIVAEEEADDPGGARLVEKANDLGPTHTQKL